MPPVELLGHAPARATRNARLFSYERRLWGSVDVAARLATNR
jgi:hypothetical protein